MKIEMLQQKTEMKLFHPQQKKTETHWLALPSPLTKDYHGKQFFPLFVV